jgi:hypothetical protein
MSTRNLINTISSAYKKNVDGCIGFNLQEMAWYSGYLNRNDSSILPQAGPLLFINEDNINWTTGLTINFTYNEAIVTGWGTGYLINGEVPYHYKIYSGEYIHKTGSVYFDTGTRSMTQLLFTGEEYIHKLTSIFFTPSYATYEWRCFCLADNGSRIAYGFNTEKERNLIDMLEKSNFVAPPQCTICKGTRYDNRVICPNCGGYGYIGYNAKDAMLALRGKDFDIVQRNEQIQSMVYRLWAKRSMLVPTEKEVTRYFTHFLRIVDTGFLSMEKKYTPDIVWSIRAPLYGSSGIGIGTNISSTGVSTQELLDDVAPAGTNGKLEAFNVITDDDSVVPYETDYFEGAMLPKKIIPMMPRSWGYHWGTTWRGYDKYFEENSGLKNFAPTGFWTGYDLTGVGTATGWDGGNFFKGVLAVNYSGWYFYSNPYSGVGP